MTEGRFYWLKLKRDFFKRHDIRIIESMPNGKDYILFYLKLLCESVDHEGNLRFSEQIPYNAEMLSTITNTNIDIVKSAINIFTQLEMMEILDDGTYYMNEVNKMIGSAVDNDNANRQRRFRERKKMDALQNVTEPLQNVTPCVTNNNESKSKRIDIDIDIKKDKKQIAKRFVPPSLDDVKSYCLERGNNVDAEAFIDFYESKGWKVGNQKMKDWKACVRTWERRETKTNNNNISSNQFGEFPQRECDNDEMERILLNGRYKNN